MSAVRKTPPRATDSPFNLTVSFAPKTSQPRAPRKQAVAKSVGTLESTETALPAPAAAAPVAPSAAAEPALPKRRRLAKAFERPLDKVLRKKSEAVVAAPTKSENAPGRHDFTVTTGERALHARPATSSRAHAWAMRPLRREPAASADCFAVS